MTLNTFQVKESTILTTEMAPVKFVIKVSDPKN